MKVYGLSNHLRVSIGTQEENIKFLNELKSFFRKLKMTLPFKKISIVGLGLIGTSILHAINEKKRRSDNLCL